MMSQVCDCPANLERALLTDMDLVLCRALYALDRRQLWRALCCESTCADPRAVILHLRQRGKEPD